MNPEIVPLESLQFGFCRIGPPTLRKIGDLTKFPRNHWPKICACDTKNLRYTRHHNNLIPVAIYAETGNIEGFGVSVASDASKQRHY